MVVPYGKIFEKAHIDIIGSSISMAASIGQPNEVLLGESIHDIAFSSAQNNRKDISYNSKQFTKINLDPSKWNYKSNVSGRVYSVYSYEVNTLWVMVMILYL